MAKKAKKGKIFSSIVSAFSKKAPSKPRKKKAVSKKKVKKPVKKVVSKKRPVKKVKRKVVKKPVKKIKAVSKKKVARVKRKAVSKKKVRKQIRKVVKKPRVKEEKFEVGFEEVVIKCPSCGRGFRIVKSSGFSTEGMLCQRCAAGGGVGLDEEGEL